ncbi:septum formation initiator family protein [Aurantibacter sp.]|uniref:septum formation initiator family protein n=1 Tax=Aurantibacter sp. TaxID=2807103 RepID=UPI0035C7ACC6
MLKYFKNIYIIIFAVFLIWMLFIDTNSFLMHQDLNNDISDLEEEKDYYNKEIIADKKALKKLKTKDGLEKFARESYYMKREKEDIYIIEYQDSLKLKKDE